MEPQNESGKKTPAVITSEIGYGAEPLRRPEIQEGEELIFDLPGRIVRRNGGDGVDIRSHYLLVLKHYGMCFIRVRHGGGVETVNLGTQGKTVVEAMALLSDDQRYCLAFSLYHVHNEARRNGSSEAETRVKRAFLEGRLTKRTKGGVTRCEERVGMTVTTRGVASAG